MPLVKHVVERPVHHQLPQERHKSLSRAMACATVAKPKGLDRMKLFRISSYHLRRSGTGT